MWKNLFYESKIKFAFKGRTNNTLLQLFRYTFVGGFAFLVDFGTLLILTEYLHIYYLVSACIAFIIGLILNYVMSVNWVFNSRAIENPIAEFLLFTLIGIIGLGFNEVFLWILTEVFTIYYLISKIITSILICFWNFFARKTLLFNKQKSSI